MAISAGLLAGAGTGVSLLSSLFGGGKKNSNYDTAKQLYRDFGYSRSPWGMTTSGGNMINDIVTSALLGKLSSAGGMGTDQGNEWLTNLYNSFLGSRTGNYGLSNYGIGNDLVTRGLSNYYANTGSQNTGVTFTPYGG